MAAPPKANATPPQLQQQQQAAPKNTAAAGGKRQGPNSQRHTSSLVNNAAAIPGPHAAAVVPVAAPVGTVYHQPHYQVFPVVTTTTTTTVVTANGSSDYPHQQQQQQQEGIAEGQQASASMPAVAARQQFTVLPVTHLHSIPISQHQLQQQQLHQSLPIQQHQHQQHHPRAAYFVQGSVSLNSPDYPRTNGRRNSTFALWVGNLPEDVTTEEMKMLFQGHNYVNIFVRHKYKCAFVNFVDEASGLAAQAAVHNREYRGKNLVVRPKPASEDDNKLQDAPQWQSNRSRVSSASSTTTIPGRLVPRYFGIHTDLQSITNSMQSNNLLSIRADIAASINSALKENESVYIVCSSADNMHILGYAAVFAQSAPLDNANDSINLKWHKIKSVPLDKIIDHIGSTHWQNLDDGIEISEAIGSQIIGFFDAVNDPDAPQSEQQQHQLQLSVPEGNFTNPNSPSLPMYNSYQPQIPRIPGAAYPGFQTGFAEYPPAQMYPPAGYQQGIPMPMHLSGALATPPIYPYYYPQFGAPANHLIELQNGASTDANAPTVPFDNVVPFMPYYPQSYLNYVYYQQGGSAYPQPYVSAPSSRRNSKERSAYRCRVCSDVANTLFKPCDHSVFCSKCSNDQVLPIQCHVCKKSVTEIFLQPSA